VRCAWSGAAVIGPSVSTFYFDQSGAGWTASLSNFFDSIKNRLPAGTVVSVPNTGDLIDDATGDLVGTWTDGTAGGATGTGGALYSQGVGFRVKWFTGGFHGGRRVVGSTFIVPMDDSMRDAAGTLGGAQIASVVTAADGLIGASSHVMKVWSKPKPGASDGASHVITSSSVPDAISWLRTRRT